MTAINRNVTMMPKVPAKTSTEVAAPKQEAAKPAEAPIAKDSFVGSLLKDGKLLGSNGISPEWSGSFDETASANASVETSGQVSGKYGEASYDAQASIEAIAGVKGQARLDMNGLDASINAKVGVTAEASVHGKASTTVSLGGVPVDASVEGTAKASATISAEAVGTAKITRDPPTAVIEGEVGASAVVKVEGDVKASAGPFSVTASGYASAGAEATAKGGIGFKDGKLSIHGSAGAALGLGVGGSVDVEVDVNQLGDMAKKAADVNGDGKLGVDDAVAAGKAVVNEAKDVAKSAAKKVAGWFGF